MRNIFFSLISFIFFLPCLSINAFEKLFYIEPEVSQTAFSQKTLNSIELHRKSIDIIAPQIFSVNARGEVSGELDHRLLSLTQKYNIKLMPLVSNLYFDSNRVHQFLKSSTAQRKAIKKMLALCQKYKLYGMQIDFEHMHLNDKENFTDFFQKVAEAFHQNELIISVAVLPHPSLETSFERWYLKYWSGAYDYLPLGENADFVTLMTYDQHMLYTTPGPVATPQWMKASLDEILKSIPKEKVSLGVPVFSTYWYTGKLSLSPRMPKVSKIPNEYTYRSISQIMSYKEIEKIRIKDEVPIIWSAEWKSSYGIYMQDFKTRYLFVENYRSFVSKSDLVSQTDIRGMSVWVLGDEDPKIWKNKNLK